MAAAGVPRGYSSRQEYAKEVLGMDIGGVMQQPPAFIQDKSFGNFTPVKFDIVALPRMSTKRVSVHDVSIANDEFSNEGEAATFWKEFYRAKDAEYKALWNQFDAAGDEESKIALNRQYQKALNLREKFKRDYALTFDKQVSSGAVNLMDSKKVEEYTMDDLKHNRPLLESIQRTNGAYNNNGTLKTRDELLKEWVRDQQLIEWNVGRKGINAIKQSRMSEEQKIDFGIQALTFSKTKGWSAFSEGGISGKETFENIALALATDPLTYATRGIGALATLLTKTATKLAPKAANAEKVIAGWLNNHLKTKTALKSGGYASAYTATFMAADSLSDQNILVQAKLQDDIDLGEVGKEALIGAVLGFGIGITLGGVGVGAGASRQALRNRAEKWRIREGLNDQEFINKVGAAVSNKNDLKAFLRAIGYDRKAVKEEAKRFKVEQEAYVTPTVVRNSEDSLLATKLGQEKFPPMESGPIVPKAVEKLAAEKLIPKPKTNAQVAKNERILEARKRVKQQEKVEDVLAEDYINIGRIEMPRFNRWGFNTYRYINDRISPKRWASTRTWYDPEVQMIYSAGRGLGEAMASARVAVDMNVAKINSKIGGFYKQHAKELGDVNKLIENGIKAKGVTPVQKEYINMVLNAKKKIVTDAYKAKVITKTDYNRFMKDDSYVPRVWNTNYLTTPQGIAEFGEYLSAVLKKSPASAKKLVRNITGEKEFADEFLKGAMNARDIKRLWHFNAIDRTNISRSSHLEHKRKFELPARMERDLDPFMARGEERWAMFFNDTIRRNEFAKRFGPNDERVVKFIKKMRSEAKKSKDPAKNIAARDLEEIYFTAVGDPKKSSIIAETIEDAIAGRAIAKINAFQNWKLGMASIPNSTQVFVNGTTLLAKTTNLLTLPYKAISGLVKATVKTPKGKEIIRRAGTLGDMDMAKIATENSPHARIVDRQFIFKNKVINFAFGGPLRTLNEPTLFLRRVGFIPIERWNRSAGATFGYGHINDLHTMLQRLVSKGKGNSVKSRNIQRQMKELGVSNPLKPELTGDDIAIASHMFNKKVNFSGESAVLPINWHKPWFKLATKFKSFMFYQARFIKREVADELFIHHNAKPLLVYLAAAGVAGNAIEQIRGALTGKEIEKNRGPLELLITGIGHAGSLGLWYQTMEDVVEKGASSFGNILGPTATDIADTLSDIADADIKSILIRIMPNIPGKGQLRNEWRDI